jgi:FO synthase subunit 2
MSGERPWRVPGFPLGEDAFVQYVYDLCLLALREGLLPHANIGVLHQRHLAHLREVSASLGLMLETANPWLPAHRQGKVIEERIAHIEAAGRLRIPFTTGILVGIGETAEDRREALALIRALQRRYGHIQEVIIQNFRAQPSTPLAAWPEPTLQEMVETVRLARSLMPDLPIQVPPNLNPDLAPLLEAGANDLGGISTEPDWINPNHPWPSVADLTAKVRSLGFSLRERLPVYPEVQADLAPAADTLRRELVGDRVTYVVNANINFTNICAGSCRFCAFRRSPGAGDAFLLPQGEVLAKAARAAQAGATELCLQGGLHPELGLGYYLGLLRALKEAFPQLHLHAFSPMEVWWMAHRSGLGLGYVLSTLREHGLDSMPGTAAEILDDEVRRRICPDKLTTAQWVQVITAAHRLGIRSTATMMFGHIEHWQHRVRHLEVLRRIQQETGGFTELVLLPFVPGNSPLARRYRLGPVPLDEVLKVTAYSRLYLGRDLPNIQNSWVKIGVEGVQRSLGCGANDFGGTLMEEHISRCAGADHGQYLSPEDIQRAIRAAGRIPCQRDTLYNRIPERVCVRNIAP